MRSNRFFNAIRIQFRVPVRGSPARAAPVPLEHYRDQRILFVTFHLAALDGLVAADARREDAVLHRLQDFPGPALPLFTDAAGHGEQHPPVEGVGTVAGGWFALDVFDGGKQVGKTAQRVPASGVGMIARLAATSALIASTSSVG